MKLGIVGLPNVGKSTLFNAITNAGAQSANYPFCTIEPNIGTVAVPDYRLDALSAIYDPDKITPAAIEFVDIAGLVKGASRGEGLGNKFLSHIREVDAICHVVRCFDDDNIIHVNGVINALSDIETINLELIFADMDILTKRIDRVGKAAKTDKSAASELEVLLILKENLDKGIPARSVELTKEQDLLIKDVSLISKKPIIYVANLSEEDFLKDIGNNKNLQNIIALAKKEHAQVLPICAKIEEDISSLPIEEKIMFLSDLKLDHSGLDRLIEKSYELLGLISYLTAGKQEVRAWTIAKGTKAPGAAGKIHSDFEKGFIRAEVISYKDLIDNKTMNAAKEKGLVRSEGKEYIMQDGDIVLFRFNV